MALRTLIAVAQLLAAEPPPPVEPAPAVVENLGPPWHFDLSFAGGVAAMAGETWGQIGVTVGIARRTHGPFAIAIRGELLTTNRTPEIGDVILGETLRGLVGLEYTAYRRTGAFAPQIVASGGIGRELTAWDGALIDRTLAYVGVEARPGFSIPSSAPYRGIRKLGFEVGMRLQVASAYEPASIARSCTRCDAMAAEPGIDLALLFYYGLAFGR